jgi:hypothetical protein
MRRRWRAEKCASLACNERQDDELQLGLSPTARKGASSASPLRLLRGRRESESEEWRCCGARE